MIAAIIPTIKKKVINELTTNANPANTRPLFNLLVARTAQILTKNPIKGIVIKNNAIIPIGTPDMDIGPPNVC